MKIKKILILGSTGSIGKSTLKVIKNYQNKIKIPISILNIGGIANITQIEKDFNCWWLWIHWWLFNRLFNFK